MKKILLAIKGSPRRNKNSDQLLQKVLTEIPDDREKRLSIKEVIPSELEIAPCRSCFACDEDGKCIIEDDMQDLYPELITADIFVITVPVFFSGLPAQLKALIDRCQALWALREKKKGEITGQQRQGYLLATGGAPAYRNQFKAITIVLNMFFNTLNINLQNKIPVTDVDELPVDSRNDIQQRISAVSREIAGAIENENK